MAITVSKGKRKYKLNCLFDTGSQRTYFSGQVIEKLGCYKSFLTPVEYVVKTFLGSKTKKLKQVVVGIGVNKGNSLPLPVLINEEFDMNLRFDNFKSVKNNLLNLNYKLAFLHEKNDIHAHGLLGIDGGLHKGLSLGVSNWHFPVRQLPTFFIWKSKYPLNSSEQRFST